MENLVTDDSMEVYAHLHDLGLFLKIRMKVLVALMHHLMLARR